MLIASRKTDRQLCQSCACALPIFLTLLSPIRGTAQTTAFLVRDINTATVVASSAPSQFVTIGELVRGIGNAVRGCV